MNLKNILMMGVLLSVTMFSQQFTPGDHELLLMPTAYTMPEKTSYFSDYELLLLNYSYAVTSSTHLSAFTFFPITTRFYESLTLGFKQKVWSTDILQTSAYGTFTPKESLFSIGEVFSFGERRRSFHFSIAYVKFVEDVKPFWVYMAGIRIDASEKSSIILEYEKLSAVGQEGGTAMLTFGLRIRSTNMSWEIAGMRPLEYTGELLAMPLLKVGYYFN